MRLGEDYDLYIRALASGARYKVIHSCGYGAVVRGDLPGGSHRTEDLRRLYEADRALLRAFALPPQAAEALRRHERHIRGKYELLPVSRHSKVQSGPRAALSLMSAAHPRRLPGNCGRHSVRQDRTMAATAGSVNVRGDHAETFSGRAYEISATARPASIQRYAYLHSFPAAS